MSAESRVDFLRACLEFNSKNEAKYVVSNSIEINYDTLTAMSSTTSEWSEAAKEALAIFQANQKAHVDALFEAMINKEEEIDSFFSLTKDYKRCVPESKALEYLGSIYVNHNPCKKDSSASKIFDFRECKDILHRDVCEASNYYRPDPSDFYEGLGWAFSTCFEFNRCTTDDFNPEYALA